MMSNDSFNRTRLADIFNSISDEPLMDEVARRMLAKPDFYGKSCDHQPLIEAVEEAGWHMVRRAA